MSFKSAPRHCLTAALLCAASSIASIAQAQQSAPAAIEDEVDITVTATRVQTAVSDLAASVSIVSGKTLSEQLAVSADLNDVLGKSVPGLVANNERGFSNGRGPLLRGRPASVLINGVPVNQIQRSSGFDLGLIDPLAIERVEVNRGATAVYGFGASGGVINILTRRATSETPLFSAQAQTFFSTEDFDNSIGFKTYVSGGYKQANGIDIQLGAGVTRTGGAIDTKGNLIDSQAVSIYNVDGNIGVPLGSDASVRLSGNFFRRDFRKAYEVPAYIFGACETEDCDTIIGGFDPRVAVQTPDPGQDKQYQQNYVVSVNFTHANIFGSTLDITAYTQKNTFLYRNIYSDFGDPPSLYLQSNSQNNSRIGIRSNLTSEFDVGGTDNLSLTYGLDYLEDRLSRPLLDNGGAQTQALRYAPEGIAPVFSLGEEGRPFSPPVTLRSYAGFLQAKWEVGQIILSGGVRHEEFRPRSRGKIVTNFFGPGDDLIYLSGRMPGYGATLFNAGVVWSPSEGTELFSGISQGLEVTEIGRALRSLADSGVPANPRLIESQPSKTTQYEVGYRGRYGPLRVTASAYLSNAPLASELQFISPFVPLEPLRRPERIWGFEATVDYRLSPSLVLGGIFTYQDGHFKDGGTKRDLTNDRVTPPRLTAYLEFKPADDFSVKIQGTNVFNRSQFAFDDPILFGLPDFEGNVDGYFVADLVINARLGKGNLSVGVENILNETYVVPERQAFGDINDYVRAEGRRVTIGYRFDF